MTELNTDRITEINAMMAELNDKFILGKAAEDFEYLQEYHDMMSVLSAELMVLMSKDTNEILKQANELSTRGKQ